MNLRKYWSHRTSAPVGALIALAAAVPAVPVAFLGGAGVLILGSASTADAQIVSSGMTGMVRTGQGQPIAGANVVAMHVPTGTTYSATTRANGRFDFRGLIVGGPYELSVTADGYKDGLRTGVSTVLGTEVEVNVALEPTTGDVVMLEEFTVEASTNDLNAGAIGAGSAYSSAQLGMKPTSERSLADVISASAHVALRETFGDREESQLTALGQNNRYNSIMIDGARINDQFGLNGTGLASFFNPLSLDTIEQLSVQVSPYDVRMAGATGAYVNAVTKSGTNSFKGSAYYLFRGDSFMGTQLQGYNERENFLTGAEVLPKLERRTFGATLGGPIIKNKLFFFVAYEDFASLSAGRDPRFTTAQEQTILDRLNQYAQAAGKTIDWGNPVTTATTNKSVDEKIIGKLDWNITDGHRMSVRYSKTEGEVPQFGNFASSSASLNGVSGGITTALDGQFYSQQRTEESIAVQVFSQWSPDFKTEIKFSDNTQDQLTPLNSVAPAILITGLTGTDLVDGRTVTPNSDGTRGGSLWAGTEQFRMGNQINVDSRQFSVSGDYFRGDLVFSAGVEREESDYFNIFRQGSFGRVAYRTYNDFLNDTNAVIVRNYYDPSIRDVADISDFATNAIFGQVKWDVNPRLYLIFGLRYEVADMDSVPAFNQALFTASGFRNDGTLDGSSSISPRFGFNLTLDNERKLQLRGGLGHFLGKAPWVFFSNSFNAIGVGDFSRSSTDSSNPLPDSLTDYLRDHFDPDSPIGTGTDNPSLRRTVNWMDDGMELPQVWRANFAVERRLEFLDSIFTAEIIRTEIDQAIFIRNENLKPTTALAADGRQRFAGNPFTQANALYPGFTDLYRISNVDAGKSTYLTFGWDRPIKDGWGFNFAYTFGDSTEAQAIGQTTASGQWQRNVVFNQGEVEEDTSDFEIKDRIQLTLSRQFELRDGWKTTASLYYEGRTGNPYSFVYGSDINGDGRTDNDLIAVPSDPNDPRFDFSGLTAVQVQNYFSFLSQLNIDEFGGGIAPKNAFHEPWVNRLDLKIEQTLPLYGDVRMKLFFDFINIGSFIDDDLFGFTEIAPSLSNGVFRKRFFGNASYDNATGRIKPAALNSLPTGFNIDNGMSRWRIQLGAKVEF